MKKKYRYLAVLLSFICLFSGCSFPGSDKDDLQDGLSQYYVNEEGTKLIPDRFNTDKTQTAEQVTAVVENLKNQENGKYKLRILPENVSIQEYRLENSQVVLDMSSEYGRLEKTREILTRAGLVKSFNQIEGVDSVQILINGQARIGADGKELPAMTADDFVEAEGREIDAYQYGTFTLYFADSDGKHLVTEKQKVYYSASVPKEREVVELLLKGPINTQLMGTMPTDLKILNVTLADGIVYVNLNDAFLNVTPQVTENIMVYSLVNSLLELEGTQKVQISINGETKFVLGDGIDLSQYLTRNTDLIQE